ncbi:hypothetical protein GJ496_008566 [Pomphorhynchus laevis]|nr:hypothetical protein GJ496_008566 [Pomphorhynchus laevis]
MSATVDSVNELKTASVVATEVFDQKLSVGVKTKQNKRHLADSCKDILENVRDKDDRFPPTGNSPLEDGEIEDEESADESVDNQSVKTKPATTEKRNTIGKCRLDPSAIATLKRALPVSEHSDTENKGRRLNSDADSSRFQRLTSSRGSTKYLKRSTSRSRSGKPFTRLDKTSSAASTGPAHANDRHWNNNTSKPNDIAKNETTAESSSESTTSKQQNRQQRTSASFRNQARINRKPTPVCKFFIESRCNKGSECPFSHDAQPLKRVELCKFYLNGFCVKHDHCNFMHNDFPCKFFHGPTNKCNSPLGECRFSHDPITDPRVKAAFEKILSENNQEDTNTATTSNRSSSEIENDLSAQLTSSQQNHPKPSLLGSPPKLTTIVTEASQAGGHQQSTNVRFNSAANSHQYYKDSVLTHQPAVSIAVNNTANLGNSSSSVMYNDDSQPQQHRRVVPSPMHMIHPAAMVHHHQRAFHVVNGGPTLPPHPSHPQPMVPQQQPICDSKGPVDSSRYNQDKSSPQFNTNQWPAHGRHPPPPPIMHPHLTFNQRLCTQDIMRIQPPPPPQLPMPQSSAAMFSCAQRIPSTAGNHLTSVGGKQMMAVPPQPRMRLAAAHPHSYHGIAKASYVNEPMGNWISTTAMPLPPHPTMRYAYPAAWPAAQHIRHLQNQAMHPLRGIAPKDNAAMMNILDSNSHMDSMNNNNDPIINQPDNFQTLQDLINAVGLEASPETNDTDNTKNNGNETSNICTRLEEILKSLQSNNGNSDEDESKANSHQTHPLSSEAAISYIHAKTDSFRYRVFKIDLSASRKRTYLPVSATGSDIVKDGRTRDPRLRRSTLKDPRMHPDHKQAESEAKPPVPVQSTVNNISFNQTAYSNPTGVKPTLSRLSDPRLAKLLKQYASSTTSSMG